MKIYSNSSDLLGPVQDKDGSLLHSFTFVHSLMLSQKQKFHTRYFMINRGSYTNYLHPLYLHVSFYFPNSKCCILKRFHLFVDFVIRTFQNHRLYSFIYVFIYEAFALPLRDKSCKRKCRINSCLPPPFLKLPCFVLHVSLRPLIDQTCLSVCLSWTSNILHLHYGKTKTPVSHL